MKYHTRLHDKDTTVLLLLLCSLGVFIMLVHLRMPFSLLMVYTSENTAGVIYIYIFIHSGTLSFQIRPFPTFTLKQHTKAHCIRNRERRKNKTKTKKVEWPIVDL